MTIYARPGPARDWLRDAHGDPSYARLLCGALDAHGMQRCPGPLAWISLPGVTTCEFDGMQLQGAVWRPVRVARKHYAKTGDFTEPATPRRVDHLAVRNQDPSRARTIEIDRASEARRVECPRCGTEQEIPPRKLLQAQLSMA